MEEKILWLVIGIMIGATLGVFVMSLCVAASNSNRDNEWRRWMNMIKPGDTVKVIGKTLCGGRECELIPIGTVCTVQEVDLTVEGWCLRIRDSHENDFWYLEKDVEKGHVVTRWVKESESTRKWLISGPDLPTLDIVADSFDAALAEARIVDVRYNTGQVKED